MSGPIPVLEAVEWREPAPGGGSQAQVFRLSDGRFAIVKFPENPQGELVLANEFISCQLAELLELPINRALLVSIDERLLRLPRANGQISSTFSAGVRCGMIRFEGANGAQPKDILDTCDNSGELHLIQVFEQLVIRQDGRQLLTFPNSGPKGKRFAAYDYGFAFGGQPNWSAGTLGGLARAQLPATDPFSGQPYSDGSELSPVINRLRNLTRVQISETLMKLHPPRWGLKLDDVEALVPVLLTRSQDLVRDFDDRLHKRLETP